jgi:hypothetical protein
MQLSYLHQGKSKGKVFTIAKAPSQIKNTFNITRLIPVTLSIQTLLGV